MAVIKTSSVIGIARTVSAGACSYCETEANTPPKAMRCSISGRTADPDGRRGGGAAGADVPALRLRTRGGRTRARHAREGRNRNLLNPRKQPLRAGRRAGAPAARPGRRPLRPWRASRSSGPPRVPGPVTSGGSAYANVRTRGGIPNSALLLLPGEECGRRGMRCAAVWSAPAEIRSCEKGDGPFRSAGRYRSAGRRGSRGPGGARRGACPGACPGQGRRVPGGAVRRLGCRGGDG